MLFNSVHFLAFFPIVVLVYWLIPKQIRYLWLLLASYYFYMSWNAKYAILIALSTVITYAGGIGMEYFRDRRQQKKLVLFLCFFVNLGILILFKYADFLLSNVNAVLSRLSVGLISAPFDLILPVGISFYTFQALGYTVDVYRGDISAERNLFRYALFVSFFPQLVAGPIERSKNLLSQMEDIPRLTPKIDKIYAGLLTMLWGLFLKMVIADRICVFADSVFNQYYLYGSIELVVGAVAFALQIYCDFSSYSTIAIGAAQVMGFTLMENFDTPYLASSIKDFWRRWHISLSTWFRDYLYIPLGGRRCSKPRRYFNLMVTFLVSGLWHGASWHYVAWGGIHGVYQIAESELHPLVSRLEERLHVKRDCFSYRFLQRARTFLLVVFAWIFFRANGLRNALSYIGRIFTHWDPWVLFDGTLYTLGLGRFEVNVLFAALLVLFAAEAIRYLSHRTVSDFLVQQNLWFQYVFIIGLVFAIVIYGQYGAAFDAKSFIYFQF